MLWVGSGFLCKEGNFCSSALPMCTSRGSGLWTSRPHSLMMFKYFPARSSQIMSLYSIAKYRALRQLSLCLSLKCIIANCSLLVACKRTPYCLIESFYELLQAATGLCQLKDSNTVKILRYLLWEWTLCSFLGKQECRVWALHLQILLQRWCASSSPCICLSSKLTPSLNSHCLAQHSAQWEIASVISF